MRETALDKLFNKPRKNLMWIFTGIITASALYTIFFSQAPDFEIDDSDEIKITGKKDKDKEKEQDTKKIKSGLSRKEIFTFLSKRKIYPDIDTPLPELEKLVKDIQKEQIIKIGSSSYSAETNEKY
ncbi:hypothetical protein PACTADRAFT_52035 [Pachysolen tannophilus NRRL Y-2460]|uniref:Uncharacterized protein n=1 Tax=Pachysolen tannophilus NRRL Y-2460 TaxID=669874 RepID=A0A1E4TNX2_PACTA|nr:hypothetical protein PACTADRAFT_52035 [Pachysolen tannophilus NRRL Y-2460]